MEWLTSNVFFLVILLLCVGMHMFGHGGHGGQGGHSGHGDADRLDRDEEGATRDRSHRHG